MTAPARLYLDNAATSFPKPPTVLEAVLHYSRELGTSPGRGSYAQSLEAGRLLESCRERICQLIGAGPHPRQVIFTLNCSDALNLGLKGILRRGDHVISSAMDHNSILRPLHHLAREQGLSFTLVPCDRRTGLIDPLDVAAACTPRTRLLATHHGSNVTGTVQNLESLAQVARQKSLVFLVDAAQTLGHVPLDVGRLGIDLLAAPGHKGLLGPLGTGFLYIRPGLESEMTTLREGGTGSVSELEEQPDFLPDRFEPGSHNMPGIAGLLAGVNWILDRGVKNLAAHEQSLMHAFLETLENQDTGGLSLYGPAEVENRCAVFSIRIEGFETPQQLSNHLEQEFGLLTRSGLHCAPGAHRTIGTFDRGGTTRLSFGPFCTQEDAREVAETLARLGRQTACAGSGRR